MFKKQQSIFCKIAAVVFVLLLLTPCTIKADIKVSLNISTSSINKDKLSINSCSSFSRVEKEQQTVTPAAVFVQKDSDKLLGRDRTIVPCIKTQTLENKRVEENVILYSSPIFIHFLELII